MKIKDIITESKTVKVEPQKPRNFVAKNAMATTSGAGAHRDKKKEQKQGYEKHKGRGVSEGLTTEKQILTRIRQIMHDRKLSGTESNAGELHRLKQQLKDMRSEQGVSEGTINEMRYDREFEVDGWTYMTYLDVEEDNRKLFHMARDPEGQEHDIHFTPYARLDPKTFRLWVKLGAPKNLSKMGSFNREDVIKAAQAQGIAKLDPEMARAGMEDQVQEEPASRALCTSGKPDSALGASQLASCKSQGYRSRDGGKSHKVGSERVKVRGKRIKGKKYGGPLPDWS